MGKRVSELVRMHVRVVPGLLRAPLQHLVQPRLGHRPRFRVPSYSAAVPVSRCDRRTRRYATAARAVAPVSGTIRPATSESPG